MVGAQPATFSIFARPQAGSTFNIVVNICSEWCQHFNINNCSEVVNVFPDGYVIHDFDYRTVQSTVLTTVRFYAVFAAKRRESKQFLRGATFAGRKKRPSIRHLKP